MTDLMPAPSISIVSGVPVVSSLTVAEHFEKRHDDVLKAIKTKSKALDSEFTARNFAVSEYTDQTGRKLPAYNLTRDGFTIVAFGFTGAKALAWQVRYIQAFNAMERELRAKAERKRQPAMLSDEEDYGLPLRPFYTARELADILRLTPGTIHKWLALHPELPVHQQRGKSNILISRVDLLRWLREARQEGEQPKRLEPARPAVPADMDPCLYHLAEVVWKLSDVEAASERLFGHMERKHRAGQRGGHTFRNLSELHGALRRGLHANMEALKLAALVADCARREFL